MTNLDRLLEKSRELREKSTPGKVNAFEAGAWGGQGFGVSIGNDYVEEWFSTGETARKGGNALRIAHDWNLSATKDEMLTIAVEALNYIDCKCSGVWGTCDRCEGLNKIEALAAKALGES